VELILKTNPLDKLLSIDMAAVALPPASSTTAGETFSLKIGEAIS
jgi:hypothetical protein